MPRLRISNRVRVVIVMDLLDRFDRLCAVREAAGFPYVEAPFDRNEIWLELRRAEMNRRYAAAAQADAQQQEALP